MIWYMCRRDGAGSSLLVVIVAVAVGLALIHITGLPFSAALSDARELGGYAEVMNYLSPFSSAEFYLSDFPFSEQGTQHFADCKALFRNVYIVGFMAGLPICVFLQFCRKHLSRRFWFASGVSVLVFTAIISFLFC